MSEGLSDIGLWSKNYNHPSRLVESVVIKALEKCGFKGWLGFCVESVSTVKFRESRKWGFWNNKEITILRNGNDSCTVVTPFIEKTVAEKLFQTIDALL